MGAIKKPATKRHYGSGSDIIIMLHPDYQYTPKLITAMASMIAYGVFDAIIASRILGIKLLMAECRYINIFQIDF